MKKIYIFMFLLLMAACKRDYLQNKLLITSFNCIVADTINQFVVIKFSATYYTDSSIWMYFSSGIEKGQDGSDEEVRYFGLSGNNSPHENRPFHDRYLTFDSFKNGFNKNLKPFRGQSFDVEDTFRLPSNQNNGGKIILVFQNRKTNRIDTLYDKLIYERKF